MGHAPTSLGALAVNTLSCPMCCDDDVVEAHCYLSISGELIVSRYVAESITMIAGRFGHVGLCQLRTKLKKLQRETSYIAITGQWCGVIKSGCFNDQ